MEITILVVLGVLIVFNGLLALTEVAIVAARPSRLERQAGRGDRLARNALTVVTHPTRSLSTIQIGITSVGILNGIVGEAAFARPLATWLTALGVATVPAYVVATGFVVVIVTYLTIVLGELVPKRIAQNHPEALLKVTAGPLLALGALSAPFVKLLAGSTELVLRMLGVQRSSSPAVTEEEIQLLLEEGSKAGIIEDEEHRIVQNVFRLDDRPIAALMLPRSDIIALDVERSFDQNLMLIRNAEHSRFPVCQGGLDHVIGVVTARALLVRLHERREPDLRELMIPPVFVPETIGGIELLEQFRNSGVEMAFVVDEYGSVKGLVTVHDVVEAIAGEFYTGSTDESWAVQRPDGSWLFDGALPVERVQERLGLIDLPGADRARVRTLGGLMLFLIGHIPRVGEHTSWEQWQFEVVDMDGRRIDKVLVSPRATDRQDSNGRG